MSVQASYEVVTLSPRVWERVMRTYRSLPSCLASWTCSKTWGVVSS